MNLLSLAVLAQIVTSAPLLSQIIGPGGLAEVDLGGWGVISPSSDTTKININKGYGNYVGPQYAPAPVYDGYGGPVVGGPAPGFGNPQQLFNPGFQGGPPAQGFLQSRGNQLRGSRS